jgi:hypothetical protein
MWESHTAMRGLDMLYVCIHVHIYIYIYICIYIYANSFTDVRISYSYAPALYNVWLCVYVCMCVRVYVCMYITDVFKMKYLHFMYVKTCMYTCTMCRCAYN